MTMHWKAAAAALALAGLLTGCASSVSLDEDAKTGTLAGEAAQTEQVSTNPFTDPANPLSQRSIYFGFDAYDVAPEYVPYIEAHAKWLIEHPEVKIAIQGNTDERGGREYNLALGQKRSEAVKQRLVLMGVPASRLEAVSFGKEKPVATGHTEEAWTQNRRADLVYPAEYAAPAPQPAEGAQP